MENLLLQVYQNYPNLQSILVKVSDQFQSSKYKISTKPAQWNRFTNAEIST